MTQPIAKIVHPVHSEFWVEVEKPRGVDRLRRDARRDQLVRPIPIRDGNGKLLIDPVTKQPYFYVHYDQPSPEMVFDALWPHMKGWNIKNAKGEPVQFTKDNLSELFEDHLTVPKTFYFAKVDGEWQTFDNDEPVMTSSGETVIPKLDTVNQRYAAYISDALWKPETFDTDPLVNNSASQ